MSCGVAEHEPDESAAQLMRRADLALYTAKAAGRGRCELGAGPADSDLVADLTAALDAGEVTVHFQPVVEPSTGIVLGSEALVRWHRPERGVLPPEEFIPHAEETGLIVPLGAAVLRTACAMTATWNRDRREPLNVAVNLSSRQLSDPQLTQVVGEALESSGLPAHLLCLEVTETVVMEDAEASTRVLEQLRSLGVSIAIDDFGTGYSSLAYLLSLPVDLLKVDRSFVAAVDDGGPGEAIVTAVLALARTSSGSASSPRAWRRRSRTPSSARSAAASGRAGSTAGPGPLVDLVALLQRRRSERTPALHGLTLSRSILEPPPATADAPPGPARPPRGQASRGRRCPPPSVRKPRRPDEVRSLSLPTRRRRPPSRPRPGGEARHTPNERKPLALIACPNCNSEDITGTGAGQQHAAHPLRRLRPRVAARRGPPRPGPPRPCRRSTPCTPRSPRPPRCAPTSASGWSS